MSTDDHDANPCRQCWRLDQAQRQIDKLGDRIRLTEEEVKLLIAVPLGGAQLLLLAKLTEPPSFVFWALSLAGWGAAFWVGGAVARRMTR